MCKRGENIYKRNDGRWEARIKKADGKYIYVYGKSYTEVKEKKNEKLKREVEINKFRQDKVEIKASEQLNKWLSDCAQRVKLSTYENYYYCMKTYVCPYFENAKDNAFTKVELEKFVSTLNNKSTLSDSYRNKILTIFKVALRSILKDDKNMTQLLDTLSIQRRQTKAVQVFSLSEQQKIEEELINCGNLKAIGILTCFYTGLRLGELGALKWRDIDLEAKAITVSGTLSRKKNFGTGESKTKLTLGTPKNSSSHRRIPLPDFLIDIFIKHSQKEKSKEIFFLSNTLTPLDPRSLQKFYMNVLKSAGVEYRKFHTLRHTFATRALEMGVDVKTLSDLLGHANVTNTLNIYTHSLLEQKKLAIARLNSMHTTQMELNAVKRI